MIEEVMLYLKYLFLQCSWNYKTLSLIVVNEVYEVITEAEVWEYCDSIIIHLRKHFWNFWSLIIIDIGFLHSIFELIHHFHKSYIEHSQILLFLRHKKYLNHCYQHGVYLSETVEYVWLWVKDFIQYWQSW